MSKGCCSFYWRDSVISWINCDVVIDGIKVFWLPAYNNLLWSDIFTNFLDLLLSVTFWYWLTWEDSQCFILNLNLIVFMFYFFKSNWVEGNGITYGKQKAKTKTKTKTKKNSKELL